MNRRRFVMTSLAGALTPPRASAQAPHSVRRVAWFDLASPDAAFQAALRDTLRERGWREGEEISFEWIYAHGDAAQLPRLASEMVTRRVSVIVAPGTTAIRAAKDATSTIPIVMAGGGDPVGTGLVKSLQRPGGNVTGVSLVGQELMEKNLDLLGQIASGRRPVTLIRSAANPGNRFFFEHMDAAGKKLGIRVVTVDVQNAADIEAAFDRIKTDVAFMLLDPLFFIHRERIARLAVERKLRLMTPGREYVAAGVLLSYGPDYVGVVRLAAIFVDRILRGANPAEVPVEQPTKFELVINLRTAKTLGVTIPPSLLLRADHVIE